ncbi:hypothetical protein [Thiolapillus sp.]|uniref:hypothetical protein n=1 Tax=Thiolapillus sp. TaxID=2017437 RepID=UPI003AF8BBD0
MGKGDGDGKSGLSVSGQSELPGKLPDVACIIYRNGNHILYLGSLHFREIGMGRIFPAFIGVQIKNALPHQPGILIPFPDSYSEKCSGSRRTGIHQLSESPSPPPGAGLVGLSMPPPETGKITIILILHRPGETGGSEILNHQCRRTGEVNLLSFNS